MSPQKEEEPHLSSETYSISLRSESVSHCVERLQEITRTCHERSEKHRIASAACHRRHTYLSIPSLIIAAIATSAAYVPVGTRQPNQEENWVPVFIAAVATVNAILVGVINFLKLDQLSGRHTTASKNYILLANEVKDYLVKMPKESDTWFVDLRSFTKQYQEIVMNAPL